MSKKIVGIKFNTMGKCLPELYLSLLDLLLQMKSNFLSCRQ